MSEPVGQVLVIGATGSIGRLVVRRLGELGNQPRALSRDVERARRVLGADPEVVAGDLSDPASVIDVPAEGAGLVPERQQPSDDEAPDAARGTDDEHPPDRLRHDGSLTFSSDLMARRSSMAA